MSKLQLFKGLKARVFTSDKRSKLGAKDGVITDNPVTSYNFAFQPSYPQRYTLNPNIYPEPQDKLIFLVLDLE